MKTHKTVTDRYSYETKIPPMGQDELENTRKALRLIRLFRQSCWRTTK